MLGLESVVRSWLVSLGVGVGVGCLEGVVVAWFAGGCLCCGVCVRVYVCVCVCGGGGSLTCISGAQRPSRSMRAE